MLAKFIYSSSYYFISIIIIFIITFKAQADTLEPVVQFKATPNFCLTDDHFNYCEIDLLLTWSPTEESVCIISDYQNIPRWCSDDPSVTSVNLTIKTDKDINFVLVTKNNNKPLSGVKLNVTKAVSPKVRKRYRNPWSLF